MGEERITLKTGTLTINGESFTGPITDFTYETEDFVEKLEDHIIHNFSSDGLTFTCRISKIQLLHLMGIWQWVCENCPSGRVKYLMSHGSRRTRYKNFAHAIRLITKRLEKV